MPTSRLHRRFVAALLSPALAACAAVGSEGDGATGADAAAPVSACAPLSFHAYDLAVDLPLACGVEAAVFDVAIPAHGRAVARVRFEVRHTGRSAVTHFWNLHAQVGAPVLAYGIGDDVCAGRQVARGNLGYGVLDAANPRVRVRAFQGAEPCTEGALQLLSGARLEVWVEDPDPTCAGHRLAVADWYGPALANPSTYAWSGAMEPIPGVTAALDVADGAPLRVLAAVEGSPSPNPNTACGAESGTLVAETRLNPFAPPVASPLMAQLVEPVPASFGLGHVVLATYGDPIELRYAQTAGVHTASMWLGKNVVAPVTTGGCCGDATIVLLDETALER